MEVKSWALSNNLPRNTSDGDEPDHQKSGSHEQPPCAGVGSLVELEIVDQGNKAFCFITEHEERVSDLPKSIQENLPEHTKVSPLSGRASAGNVAEPDNLAQRLQQKKLARK